MGCQNDWVEIHIDLQGGELAFIPGQALWLYDWLVKFETAV